MRTAGIPMEKASDSNTSVHTASFSDDYRLTVTRDQQDLPLYTATGVTPSMLAARLSWCFNLKGPCVNLDSACSSSMMAFDLACQGLRNGDTNMVRHQAPVPQLSWPPFTAMDGKFCSALCLPDVVSLADRHSSAAPTWLWVLTCPCRYRT